MLGIVSGLLVDIRIMGILFCVVIFLFSCVDIFFNRYERKKAKHHLVLLSYFFVACLLTIYLACPFLYVHPLKKFISIFNSMSQFRWHGMLLFRGKMIAGAAIPWYYVENWFGITTPIGYLLFGIMGLILFLISFLQSPISFLKNYKNRNFIFYALLLLVPLLMVIILKSVLYDGWRHLFFIYPSFILLLLFGLNKIRQLKWIAIPCLLFSIFFTTKFMITNFPFENVYFNSLENIETKEFLRHHYELDYWGMAYKYGIQAVLQKDKSTTIKVMALPNDPFENNMAVLSTSDKHRLQLVETIDSASYFITNYRFHPDDFSFTTNQLFYKITVLNSTILAVYKLK